jgi:hypothetical protein
MDHGQQLVRRRGEDVALLMFGHGKEDDTIDWATQGQPFLQSVNAANVAFTSEQRANWGHNWMSFDFMVSNLMSDAIGDRSAWHFSGDISYLSITNASESGPDVPGLPGTDTYNTSIDWSTSWNPFHEDVVDSPNRYEISIRSLTKPQAADLTPRNLQEFNTIPRAVIEWTNTDNATGTVLQSGLATTDGDGLLTIRNVSLLTDSGSRLILTTTQPAAPSLNAIDATVIEGDQNNRTVEVVARLSRATEEDVSFDFESLSSSAVEGLDFVPVSGSVTIPSGSTAGSIIVQVVGD